MNEEHAPPNGLFVNGTGTGTGAGADVADAQTLKALEIAYDPRSSNQDRLEVLRYLERAKEQDDAPFKGFVLASDKKNTPMVRHFGLSLIESAIRLRWLRYTGDQCLAVRNWVLELARNTDKDDQTFLRNKIGQLWVEIAKRSWALEWMDMDEQLVELWSGSAVQKLLVLEILETLSEASFGKEDAGTALRGNDLCKACVEVFIPGEVLTRHFPTRDTSVNVRFGSEGWLSRISELLAQCNDGDRNDPVAQQCAIKALATFKSVVPWVILVALAETYCVQRICQTILTDSCAVRLAAIETLYALYTRYNFDDNDIRILVGPVFETDTLAVFKKLYEWSVVDIDDIDDDKYLICKKLAETMHSVGKFLQERPEALPDNVNIPDFLDLLIQMMRNESLHVSIPILHLWAQILSSQGVGDSEATLQRIGPLLDICRQRLIRYELLPEDSGLSALRFLSEDLDTVPERHAFLGNYARFCRDVVDRIVEKRPFEALSYILTQTDDVFQHLFDDQPQLDVHSYKKSSMPALRLDAQLAVVEAGLIGFARWRNSIKSQKKDDETYTAQLDAIISNLQIWCVRLLSVTYEDPTMQQRVVGLIVEFAINPLRKVPGFGLRVFQYLLETKMRVATGPLPSGAAAFNDAVNEFQRFCSHQLQRIAIRAPDMLMNTFGEIENTIARYTQVASVDEEDKDRCIAVLLVIIQRASELNEDERTSRLDSYIQPVIAKWQDPELAASLQSFDGFCGLLGITSFQDYFARRNASRTEDWTELPLDEEGAALKKNVESAHKTKAYFSVSLEKHDSNSPASAIALALWSKYLPIFIPKVLQMISLAHQFSDPSTWKQLPPEARGIPSRILKDRFWQVGISSGSRDEFYSKVEQSKSSVEGLASAIRGCLRMVRDNCYKLLSSMSLLGNVMYSFEELPGPMSTAIFDSASHLSSHQAGVVIEMMRPIIDHCPPDARRHFLTPLLTAMFNSLDQKVASEWSVIDQLRSAASADDNLLEEMKDESVLRQLTFNCVNMVTRLLDPHEVPPTSSNATKPPYLRNFILETPEVLKSVILFCTHALQMHDSRACGLITRVLRSIVGVFTGTSVEEAEIREFISTEVLKACISSLHDPYFVDIQNDLAQLIASILKRYSAMTGTPRAILLSLPGMDEKTINDSIKRIVKTDGNSRQQRVVVLKLLEGLRGISISEQGKYPMPDKKKAKTAMHEKYTMTEEGPGLKKNGSPDLGGVADMFA